MKNRTIVRMGLCGLWLAAFTLVPVQADDAADAAQANNPLANMTAFNIHSYYIGELTETDNAANQYWLRHARPFSTGEGHDWLMRASLPIVSYPNLQDGSTTQGLSDFNIFASYLFDTGNPALSVGLGPQLTMPIATDEQLGTEQWSAGLAHILFNSKSPVWQYGYLLTWQASFAGEDTREDVNSGATQPFVFRQLGGGTYLRAAPIWVYNFENDNYSIPLGVGLGQVIKQGSTVYNVFVEPQYSVADDGAGLPQWQVFVGFNMQFL